MTSVQNTTNKVTPTKIAKSIKKNPIWKAPVGSTLTCQLHATATTTPTGSSPSVASVDKTRAHQLICQVVKLPNYENHVYRVCKKNVFGEVVDCVHWKRDYAIKVLKLWCSSLQDSPFQGELFVEYVECTVADVADNSDVSTNVSTEVPTTNTHSNPTDNR